MALGKGQVFEIGKVHEIKGGFVCDVHRVVPSQANQTREMISLSIKTNKTKKAVGKNTMENKDTTHCGQCLNRWERAGKAPSSCAAEPN